MLYLGVVLGAAMKALIICVFMAISCVAGEWAVVASGSFKPNSLSQKQIKEIFLKKRGFIDNQEVFPVNLGAGEKGRIIFEEKILGMDRGEISSYWMSQHYQGITPPVTQKSQAGVKAFVKSVKGAIGYVEKSQIEPDMKVLYEF